MLFFVTHILETLPSDHFACGENLKRRIYFSNFAFAGPSPHKLVQQAPAMPVAMRIHEEFSVPHEIPKYDRQIREALKKFDWDASGGLRFQELAKVFKQPGTETGTGTPMTPEQIKV